MRNSPRVYTCRLSSRPYFHVFWEAERDRYEKCKGFLNNYCMEEVARVSCSWGAANNMQDEEFEVKLQKMSNASLKLV